MKKLMICALTALVLFVSTARVSAIDKVTITGHGAISAPADTVTVSYSVDVKAASYTDSVKKSNTAGKKIASAVKKFGTVTEESYFSYEDCTCGKWCLTRSYVLTSSQIGNVDQICSALTEAGVTSICFICFSLSDASEYEKKALDAAISDARGRAGLISSSMTEREIIDYGSCVCSYCENRVERGYVTVECSVNIIYY